MSTPEPAGSYSVARRAGDLVHTAGMTPRRDGALVKTGLLGAGIHEAEGAELTALATDRALLAAQSVVDADEALLDVVSLTVFLATTPDFARHSQVADAASALIADRMPGAPMPVRAAVGVASLPGGAPVEVQLVARIGPAPR